MTKDELIKFISNDLTASGSIAINLKEKEISRIIDMETTMLRRLYPQSFEPSFCILNKDWFLTPEFKANRQIQFPKCIVGINQFKEMRGGGRIFGINDSDLSYNRALMSDMYMSPWSTDVVMYRTVQWSTWDLMRSFDLHDIQLSFNELTHKITLLGRIPRNDIYVEAISAIPESSYWEDIMVQRWIIAKCKIQLARILGLFSTTQVGNTQFNIDSYKAEGDAEIAELKEYFNSINTMDFMTMFN